MRRDDRVVEGARLESVCMGNRTVGSNPTLSAIIFLLKIQGNVIFVVMIIQLGQRCAG